MNFKTNIKLYVAPCVLIILFLVFLIHPSNTVKIYPNTDNYMSTYTDSANGGNSAINAMNKGTSIIVTYTLGDKIKWPEVGVGLSCYKDNELTNANLSEYDYIKIKIKSKKARTVLLVLSSYYNESEVDLIAQQEIPLWKNKKHYVLPLDDFYIPNWWFKEYGYTEYDGLEFDTSSINYISILISNKVNSKSDDKIVISEIVAVESKVDKLLIVLILFCLSFVPCIINIRRNNKLTKTPKYNALEVENYEDSYNEKISNYIANNYFEPEINVSKVSCETGVPQLKIPIIIKKKYNLTFPQYINKIRIAEAKRLLIESDLQIVEIGLKIGFSNATHFNRTFKSLEKLTPLQYRKRSKEKK